MAPLVIRYKKLHEGGTAFSATRADGSVTWQRYTGAVARFFPLHDLTHLAVESVLGCRQGFYGLMADGWDMADFGSPSPRGALPEEALFVEVVVGLLDTERATGIENSAADTVAMVELQFEQRGSAATMPVLDDAVLARIRARRGELFARWAATPSGEAMELVFDAD